MSELETVLEPMVTAAASAPNSAFGELVARARRRRRRRRAASVVVACGLVAGAGALLVRPSDDDTIVVGDRSVSLPIGVTLTGLPDDLPRTAQEFEIPANRVESEARYGYDDRIFRIGDGDGDAARSVTVYRTRGQNFDVDQQLALDPTFARGPVIGGEPTIVLSGAFWINGGTGVAVQVSTTGLTAEEFDALMVGFSYDRGNDEDLGRPIPGDPEIVLSSDAPGASWRVIRTTTAAGPCLSVNVGLTGIACIESGRVQGMDLGYGLQVMIFRTAAGVGVAGRGIVSSVSTEFEGGRLHAVVVGPTAEISLGTGAGLVPLVTCPLDVGFEACLGDSGLLG